MKGHVSIRAGVLALCLPLYLAGVIACGKKEPPFLPAKEGVSLQVVDLTGEPRNGTILLKGRIQGESRPGQARDYVAGCRVRYAYYPLDKPPCAGCPINYRTELILGPEVITETGFQAEVPARERGQVYFFQVILLGTGGPIGPPSYRTVVQVPNEIG